MKTSTLLSAAATTTTMMFSIAARRTAGFALNRSAGKTATASATTRAFGGAPVMFAKAGQAEVILVGCGAPNRGMGWYHAIQMLEEK